MSRGTSGFEDRTVTLGWSTNNTVSKRELEFRVVELLSVSSDGLGSSNALDLHNLNFSVVCSVSSGHIWQQLINSTSSGQITELLSDVVLTSPALVSQVNLEVLYSFWLFFVDLLIVNKNSRFIFTLLKRRISPLTLLSFFNLFMKYQKRLLATTSLGAKMRIL